MIKTFACFELNYGVYRENDTLVFELSKTTLLEIKRNKFIRDSDALTIKQ